jgi:Fe-S cluster assembly protein SufD
MMVSESTSILSAFKAFKGEAHTGSAHIDSIYAEAREALDKLPVPNRKTEAWKYTPVNKIAKGDWSPAGAAKPLNPDEIDLPVIDAHMVWVLDGEVMIEDADLPEGATLMTMSEAKDREQSHFESTYGCVADHKSDLFIALNTAFASGGVYLRLAKNVVLDKPVHVAHVYTQPNTAVMSRHIIIAEEGAEGQMTHSFSHAEGSIYSNVITEVKVADNARFTLNKLQSGTPNSIHYSSEETHQGRDSVYTQNTITLSGGWTRNDPRVLFKGNNSVCHLNGAYVPREKQLVDNHSIIDHLVPHCESHELYKGVVYDESKAIFNGKVFVRPNAQKTNAYQQNASIVMSDKASMNSKPELEIYADDVKCSHGSTTGQLDMDALFYLQCRGLKYDTAKQMLVNAFVGEVIDRLDPGLQGWVWDRIGK